MSGAGVAGDADRDRGVVGVGAGRDRIFLVTGAGTRSGVDDGERDRARPGPASGAAPVAVASVSPEQNILLVGLDTRSDAQGNPLPQAVLDELHAGAGTTGGDNTDTMIVVHIPAGSGTATAISIPRDSYLAIAGGYSTHKINSAYTYGKHAAATALASHGVSGAALEVQSAAQGARTAILTVQQLTGLTITHYGAVNLVGFAAISQAAGGVPVCLNNPVDDPLSGAVFPAGPQVLQGAQALAFVRQRHGLPLGTWNGSNGSRSSWPAWPALCSPAPP
jgi:LCP family protein required for cell wall assembly